MFTLVKERIFWILLVPHRADWFSDLLMHRVVVYNLNNVICYRRHRVVRLLNIIRDVLVNRFRPELKLLTIVLAVKSKLSVGILA